MKYQFDGCHYSEASSHRDSHHSQHTTVKTRWVPGFSKTRKPSGARQLQDPGNR